MKTKIFTFLLIVLSLNIVAQTPQGFKYQAIARDDAGNVLMNKNIMLQISLIQGSMDGPAIYQETHSYLTNEFGLINLNIGKGLVRSGDFSSIDWSIGNYYMQVEVDIDGGTDFKVIGTSELFSVPYALYAKNAGGESRNVDQDWFVTSNNVCTGFGGSYPSGDVGIGTTTPTGKLHVYGLGYVGPPLPMLFVEHTKGYSSTFRRVINSTANALFLMQKARGTLGAELAVLQGDQIAQLRGEGYDGSGYMSAGNIIISVDGVVSPGIVPGALRFQTTDNTGNLIERLRINSLGNVGIGTTNPSSMLDVNGVISAIGGSSADWNEAYGWGDHALVGYLSSYTETDPQVGANLLNHLPKWDGTALVSSSVFDNGNVGIGTTNPTGGLHVVNNNGAVFEGEYIHGAIPAEGPGTRMMWHPYTASFRVGRVEGDQWDFANIGHYSFVAGFNSKATAGFSTAIGFNSSATGNSAIAIGSGVNATGYISAAFGRVTIASGNHSTAMGLFTLAEAHSSTAIGQYNIGGGTADSWVDSDPLFEIGNGADASNRSNALTVLKNGNTGIGTPTPTAKLEVAGDLKISDGTEGADKVLTSDANGLASWQDVSYTETDPQVGTNLLNQLSKWDGSALVSSSVYDNGNVGIGTTNPTGGLHVVNNNGAVFAGEYIHGAIPAEGAGTRMMWHPYTASFRVGRVEGDQWDFANIGHYSVATGFNTKATAGFSTAMGWASLASGNTSVAIGSNVYATGYISVAFGRVTVASGNYSTAMGLFTLAEAHSSTAIGQYNIGGGTSDSWVDSDPLFEVGNGADASNRSNALTVLKNGNTGFGTPTPTAKLEVVGDLKITDGTEGADKVLTSDANGLASWQDVSNVETDPQVGSLTLDQVPRWDGSTLTGGILQDDGINKVDLAGNIFMHNSLNGGIIEAGDEHHSIYMRMGYDTINDRLEFHEYGSIGFYTGGLIDAQIERMRIQQNGNVGIGTDDPLVSLHVADTTGVIFTGTLGDGGIPIEGTGTRLMWYPGKAAFRSGHVDNTSWDEDNTGEYSVGMGYNTKASGLASTAIGHTLFASGDYSTAIGHSIYTVGIHSTALGVYTNAIGDYSTSIGASTYAGGDYSTAMGWGSDSHGDNSTAMGHYTYAGGDYSTAMGYKTNSGSYASVAIGRYNIGKGSADSWLDTDPLFEIGNGTSESDSSNALTVLKNGNTGIGIGSPDEKLHVAGKIKVEDMQQGSSSDSLVTWNPADSTLRVIPKAPSKTHTIYFPISNLSDDAISPPKSTFEKVGYAVRYINLTDVAYAEMYFQFPMPAEFTGTSMTARVYYSSDSTTGNFVGNFATKVLSLGDNVGQPVGGGPFIAPAPSTAYDLNSFTVTFGISSSTEFVNVWIRRQSLDANDTCLGDLKIFGIAIDYQN